VVFDLAPLAVDRAGLIGQKLGAGKGMLHTDALDCKPVVDSVRAGIAHTGYHNLKADSTEAGRTEAGRSFCYTAVGRILLQALSERTGQRLEAGRRPELV
jgi:hypothetical protein